MENDLNVQQINQLLSGDIGVSSDPNVSTINSLIGENQSDTTGQGKDPISLIHKYFPEEEWQRAQQVMSAESGGKSDAVGDNYPIAGQTIPSVGLFQIRTLPGRPDTETLKDPEFNVKYAADMWKKQGWQPWTTAVRMGFAK